MKRLLVVGDSWCANSWVNWPTIVGDRLNLETINLSVEGSSNDWIFRKTIEWISCQENTDEIFVIVGLTSASRREENFNNLHPGSIFLETDKVVKFVYENLYNNELAHLQSISYILALQEFFKSKEIKYLFFDCWYDIMDCEEELLLNKKSKGIKYFNFDGHKESIEQENNEGVYYTEELNIGKMLNNINTTYFLRPDSCNGKEILKNETGHPTEQDSINIANMLVEKIKKEYKI